jgi:DNA end-binding protein Ku
MASTVWKGYLTFGLVSAPVRLYVAARSKSVRFNQLYRRRAPEGLPHLNSEFVTALSVSPEPSDNQPASIGSSPAPSASQISHVVQELRPAGEQEAIDREDLVKGYPYGPDQYVILEKSEIQSLVPKTSATMDLQRFVKLGEIDPLFFERSYYLAPDPTGEKAYALLFHAMRRTGYCGVAKVAMHRREHVVILRPHEHGIVAHTMYYVDEIRDAPVTPIDSASITQKEVVVAEAFIKALAGPFEPGSFRDEYRAGIEALIQGKAHGEEVIAPNPGSKATTSTRSERA